MKYFALIYMLFNPNASCRIQWNVLSIRYAYQVYGWNSAIAMVCGNTIVWKGASSTPLVAIATTKIIASVLERNGIPGSVASLVTGGPDIGETLVHDKQLVLFSHNFYHIVSYYT